METNKTTRLKVSSPQRVQVVIRRAKPPPGDGTPTTSIPQATVKLLVEKTDDSRDLQHLWSTSGIQSPSANAV